MMLIVCLLRVIWREKCGAWPLIPISLSVPPLVMTKPCAYGTSRPATACWLYANSEKVSHRSNRWAYFLTGSAAAPEFNKHMILHRRPLLLLLPWWQSIGGGPEWRQLPYCERRHPGGPGVLPPPQGHHLRYQILSRSVVHLRISSPFQNSPQILVWEVKSVCAVQSILVYEGCCAEVQQVYMFPSCCDSERHCCRPDPN